MVDFGLWLDLFIHDGINILFKIYDDFVRLFGLNSLCKRPRGGFIPLSFIWVNQHMYQCGVKILQFCFNLTDSSKCFLDCGIVHFVDRSRIFSFTPAQLASTSPKNKILLRKKKAVNVQNRLQPSQYQTKFILTAIIRKRQPELEKVYD